MRARKRKPRGSQQKTDKVKGSQELIGKTLTQLRTEKTDLLCEGVEVGHRDHQ